eukprot:34241-Eustigmatos_ZCMA.PRE.1
MVQPRTTRSADQIGEPDDGFEEPCLARLEQLPQKLTARADHQIDQALHRDVIDQPVHRDMCVCATTDIY